MSGSRIRSVRSKLLLIVLLTNVVAILIAGASLLYIDARGYEAAQRVEFDRAARMLGKASVPALDFADEQLASQSLAMLQADPRVLAGALYLPSGQRFAEYRREQAADEDIPLLPEEEGQRVIGDRIEVVRRVQSQDRIVGSLFIRAHYGLADRLVSYLNTLIVAMLASLAMATVLSLWLRRWITQPIKQVSDTARKVIDSRDFSLRAQKTSDDEIGLLVEGFNTMLAEIDQRTEAIEASRQELEQEVAERRTVQASLQRSELRNRSLVSALSTVIWTADTSGGFSEAQLPWRRFTGQTDADAQGLGWRSAFHRDDQAALDRAWSIAMNGRQSFEIEARLWHGGSESYRQVVVRGVPLLDENDRVQEWIGALIDVEDRRAAERRVLELNSELEQRVADRTAELEVTNAALRQRTQEAEAASQSKADFLANMSHEIRTPMNAVLGFAFLLEREKLSSEQMDLVRKIRRAGRSLQTIINDILDFSKIEAGKLQIERSPFALIDVLDSLSSVMSANAGERDIELVITPPADLDRKLVGDALRLEQILVNLTGNAIKFTERGHVAVSISVLQREGNQARLRFEVSDTGIGIPADKLPSLFSAFVQADSSTTRRFGGTGLGLAICRHLVSGMGGEIGVESKSGRGSLFWFELPFELAELQSQEPKELSDLDLLVADDSDHSRHSILMTARSIGWRAQAVESGTQAIAQIEQRLKASSEFDVILLDWKMPELDGLSAARLIRQRIGYPRSPIVLMATAYSRDELMAEGAQEVVDGILSKPVTSSSLYDAVAQAQRKRGKLVKPQPAALTPGQRLSGLRVLVVDDVDINREVASRMLHSEGAEVEAAEDGRQALHLLLENLGRIDLVLMDVQMPVMDGHEAAAAIRKDERLKHLPVVALTAGAFKSQVDAAEAAGMDAFLAKPFEIEALVEMILRLTRRPLEPGSKDPSPEVQVAEADSSEPALLDWEHALASWQDADALRRYLRKFSQEYAEADAEVERHARTGDCAAASTYLHKLKGAAGSLSLFRLSSVAQALERDFKHGEPVADLIQAFRRCLRDTQDSIEAQSKPAPG